MDSAETTYRDTMLAIAGRLEGYRAKYEAGRDSRAVFAHAYALISRRLADELFRGGFSDPAWIVSLDEALAKRYFEALDAFDQNRPLPKAWEHVFGAICRERSSVLEDLVYSMAAHIVHDLPLALVDVEFTSKEQASRIRDFHRVGDILATGIDDIQRQVAERYNPLLKWLDRLGKGFDEILTSYGMKLARGMAWYNATRLVDPRSRTEAQESIARSPGILIDKIRRSPFWSIRIVLRLTRCFARLFRRWPAS